MATAQLGTLMRHVKGLAAGPDGRPRTDRQLLDDFASRGDQGAFADLVGRHGGMVLRVYRRVLRHEQDAEDAFQATFLVLARNAASIRRRVALASWLYGVAYRTALKAKRGAARRRHHEARLRQRTPPPAAGPTWDDVQAVLDEEVWRLPESLRSAFVLCVLDGKTEPAAAAELGVKEGTLSWRLARARRRLRTQLTRRGIQLSAVLAALFLARDAGRAAVPAALATATVRFGLLVAAGEPAAAIPTHVAALAAGVTRAMSLTKTRIVIAVLLAACLLAAAGVPTLQPLAAKERQSAAAAQPESHTSDQAVPQNRAEEDPVAFSGRVLDPDGKPVAGAKLYLTKSWNYAERPAEATPYATTTDDGNFRFALPRARLAADHLEELVATARGFGPAWIQVGPRGQREGLTLRLVKDVPVVGQVVDLQGRPVRGATVRLLNISATAGEDLGPWLADARAKNGLSWQLEARHFKRGLPCSEFASLPRQTTTDAEGRFRLDGIGRERMALIRLEGPAIATQSLSVFTRQGEPVRGRQREAEPQLGTPADTTTYLGASFRYVAVPSKPVVGLVRDRNTKKPRAGVSVYLLNGDYFALAFLRAKTDAQGRYRLDGLPKGKGQKIIARPTDDQPYLMVHAEVPDTPGLDPVTVDFELKRGVWVEGKITDKATGKPVPGQVEYFASLGNRNVQDHPGYSGTFTPLFDNKPARIDRKDGSYRVVGLPGPGVLFVRSFSFEDYLLATERTDAEGSKGEILPTEPYWGFPTRNYNAVARIDVPRDADRATRDVTLDPGENLSGRIIGADGQPLSGARAHGLLAGAEWSQPLDRAAFTVQGYNRHRPRFVLFVHPDRKVVGALDPPKNKTDQVTVSMRPGASVAGRLVKEDGRPRPGLTLQVTFRRPGSDLWISHLPGEITTDQDGRFRLDTLLLGCRVELRRNKESLEFDAGRKPGDTKDVADVRLKRGGE
jgi:RNA polymerase sigma factor (sigma-70 family)